MTKSKLRMRCSVGELEAVGWPALIMSVAVAVGLIGAIAAKIVGMW